MALHSKEWLQFHMGSGFLFSSSLKHCYIILGEVPITTRDAILTEYQKVQQPTITIAEIFNGTANCHCNRLIWIAYLCNYTSIKSNPPWSAWPSTNTVDESVRTTVAKVGFVSEASTHSAVVQDNNIFPISRFTVLFRSIQQFIFPVDIEEDLFAVLPSLVDLAQTMYRFHYVVGALERTHARYLDVYCYTKDEAEYDVYWSSAEALSQTQSSMSSSYRPSSNFSDDWSAKN